MLTNRFLSSVNPKKQAGLTLPELLITVSIASILMTGAVPSMGSLIKGNQITTQSNEFVTALAIARSEAVKRNRPVIVTASGATEGQFNGGWQIWVDLNANGTQDTSDPVIRQHEALPSTRLTNAQSLDSVTYLQTGFPAAQATFTLCGDSSQSGRQISLPAIGVPRVTTMTCS